MDLIMYDLSGEFITFDLGLLFTLLTARLALEFNVALGRLIIDFVRKGIRR